MMVRKAVVDAKTFSSALDQVSKVLRKSSIPVLAEALVSISDGQCTLTATDIETYLFQTVPARGDALSFVFRKTKDVAKACRLFDGELELEFSDIGEGKHRSLTLCMRCGGRAVEFEVMDAEVYPVCASVEAKASPPMPPTCSNGWSSWGMPRESRRHTHAPPAATCSSPAAMFLQWMAPAWPVTRTKR